MCPSVRPPNGTKNDAEHAQAAPALWSPSTKAESAPPLAQVSSGMAGADRARDAWDGVDLAPLVRLTQDELGRTLDAIPEAKTLLMDPDLAGPLGLVADLAALRQRGVEKMFWMEEADPDTRPVHVHAPTRHLLYLCRPETRWMKTLAAHYAADAAASEGQTHYVYTVALVPHRTERCLHYLRERHLLPAVRVHDLCLEFTVHGPDVLSLEDPGAFADLFLHGDHTALFHASQALMTLQRMWGLFPRIVGKGDLANRLCDLLVRQRREHLATEECAPLSVASQEIDALIVLDRTVDLVTPLCTQLTYLGLIDEVLGIHHGFLSVDATWVGGTGAPRKMRMDGTDDALLEALQDDNFAVVGEKLHGIAQRISHDYEGRHSASTVQELRAFVSRLGSLQTEHASLRLHTHITEHLLQVTQSERFHRVLEIQQNLVGGAPVAPQLHAIDELVDLGAPALDVVRLACLASYVHGGVKAAWLDTFTTTIVHMYGYAYLPLLLALRHLRILYATPATPKGARISTWAQVAKPLHLVDDDVDERHPRDISYVFSGMAPGSIRLVQSICQHERTLQALQQGEERPTAARIAGWHGVDEAILALPGANFDVMQDEPRGARDDRVTTTLVFFVGGVTYAEIAALRLMSRQQRTRRFVVATTGMVHGALLLRGLSNVALDP